jgi:hypothetical protein
MSFLPHNVTPKMVIGGTLGLIAVAIGVRVWSQNEGGGGDFGGPQAEPQPRENARGEYGHKHGHHGRHRHHREEE